MMQSLLAVPTILTIKYGCTYHLLSLVLPKSLPLYSVVLTLLLTELILIFQTTRFSRVSVPSKTLVVHQDRLKHCFGAPQCPPTSHCHHFIVHFCHRHNTHNLSFILHCSTVLAGQTISSSGGYTSSDTPSTSLPQVPSPDPSTNYVPIHDHNALGDPQGVMQTLLLIDLRGRKQPGGEQCNSVTSM